MAYALETYDMITAGQSYDAAYRLADIRANHSFFDQHVIEERDGCYVAIDEGDYDALPQHLIDQVVCTITGRMGDDDDRMASSAIGTVLDRLFDEIDPREVPF